MKKQYRISIACTEHLGMADSVELSTFYVSIELMRISCLKDVRIRLSQNMQELRTLSLVQQHPMVQSNIKHLLLSYSYSSATILEYEAEICRMVLVQNMSTQFICKIAMQ